MQTDFIKLERHYLSDVITQIEDHPKTASDQARFDRSKSLWRHRNHFLASYLTALDLRVFSASGKPLTDAERQDLMSLAYGFMKVAA